VTVGSAPEQSIPPVPAIPENQTVPGPAVPLKRKPPSGSQILGAQSHQFQLFFNGALGPDGLNACQQLAQTVYVDYQVLSSWFGGIQIDSFDMHADPAGTNNMASHWDCGARDIHYDHTPGDIDFDRMLVNSEEIEVFEANFDGDWDCGNSFGEALSRVLAEAMYPGKTVTNGTRSPAGVWLDVPRNGQLRRNWVQFNDETDQNFDSTGCAALFLNWLHFQEGYRWDDIVQSARQLTDLTGEYLYHQLKGGGAWNSPGSGAGWTTFRNFIDSKFPPGIPTNLKTNNPFPLAGGESWNGWQNLGRPGPSFALNRPPAVAAPMVNRLSVVATGNDNAVWVLVWNGSTWLPWKSLGGTVTAGSAAIAVDRAGVYVLGRATDSTLYRYVDLPIPPGPIPWAAMGGGIFDGDLTAASWAPYRIDVFARHGGALVHRYSMDHGATFNAWESLGQPSSAVQVQGSPAAISCRARKLDVVVRGSDGHLWQIGWDGISWSPWKQITFPNAPGLPTSFLACVGLTTWWLDRLDLFVVDNAGGLLQLISFDAGQSWLSAARFGPPPSTQISTGAAAVSWGPNRIDIFVIGEDGNLWHLWWG
jgi:hypothetical protein